MQSNFQFCCGKYQLTLNRPHVMGIVNVTPDSFSDGGKFSSTDLAVEHALKMIEGGVDILDVGGESTRPGASPVGLEEELNRVIPVIKALSKVSTVPISIDTYKPEVMRQAIDAGADIVNDIRALQADSAMEVIANSNVGVCLMHMQGTPQNMQLEPHYDDVVAEVKQFLINRMNLAEVNGIVKNRILLDPGFGFGKSRAHNIALIQHLEEFNEIGQPLLVGLSRKSVLAAITGGDEGSRMFSSIAAAVISAMKGAKIIRVHDVKATVDALKVLAAVQ